MVLGLIFKFLIYFELIFVYGVRRGFSFNFLYIVSMVFNELLMFEFVYVWVFFCVFVGQFGISSLMDVVFGDSLIVQEVFVMLVLFGDDDGL